jgi:hypothetical protein
MKEPIFQCFIYCKDQTVAADISLLSARKYMEEDLPDKGRRNRPSFAKTGTLLPLDAVSEPDEFNLPPRL